MNEHAQALGRIKTAKKSASSAANALLATAARGLSPLVCTCPVPREDGTHSARCRIRLAERQREYRARKAAAGGG